MIFLVDRFGHHSYFLLARWEVTPEIVGSMVIGLAALLGIVSALVVKSGVRIWQAPIAVIVGVLLQFGALELANWIA